jgi:20S proteasome alpha/beta subunit
MILCIASKSGGNYKKSSRYDKSINIFLPQGDLLQVCYAELAAEIGESVLCLPTSDDGFIACIPSDLIHDILVDKRGIDKISKIDDEIWLAFSGELIY